MLPGKIAAFAKTGGLMLCLCCWGWSISSQLLTLDAKPTQRCTLYDRKYEQGEACDCSVTDDFCYVSKRWANDNYTCVNCPIGHYFHQNNDNGIYSCKQCVRTDYNCDDNNRARKNCVPCDRTQTPQTTTSTITEKTTAPTTVSPAKMSTPSPNTGKPSTTDSAVSNRTDKAMPSTSPRMPEERVTTKTTTATPVSTKTRGDKIASETRRTPLEIGLITALVVFFVSAIVGGIVVWCYRRCRRNYKRGQKTTSQQDSAFTYESETL